MDKDQQIDINRKKAVDVMRACFKPILPWRNFIWTHVD